MSAFEKLMEELEALHKAIPAENEDDKKIEAAAEDQADADGDGESDVTGESAGEESGEGSEETPMGKSFSIKLDDGTEMEAIDGTDLVKSLMARVETSEGQMTKSLELAVNLIKSQGEMIKSLQDKVVKIGNEGRGRKAVLSISEKKSVSELKKSEETNGISATEFMAKALSAQANGKITGLDVSRAESALNRGLPIPAEIVARVTQ